MEDMSAKVLVLVEYFFVWQNNVKRTFIFYTRCMPGKEKIRDADIQRRPTSYRPLLDLRQSEGDTYIYIHLYSPKLVAIQQTNYKHNTMKKREKKQLD